MDLEHKSPDPAPGAASAQSAQASPYRTDSPRHSYTYEQRCMALAVVADTDSVQAAADATGIPKSTLHQWANTDEGVAIIGELRTALRHKCGHLYSVIAFKALNAAMVALDRGEEHVTKDGTIVYVAPKLRDCMVAAAVATDKHALIVGMLEGSKQVDKALATLADKLLARMVDAKPKTPEPKPALPGIEGYLG